MKTATLPPLDLGLSIVEKAKASISEPNNPHMLNGALAYRLAAIVQTAERGVLFGDDLTAEIKRIAFL